MILYERIDAAERLRILVDDSSFETFEADFILYDAACLNLLRLGENARILPDEVKATLPEVPWPDIIALRHRIAHGYGHLKKTRIWDAAVLSVPPFAETLKKLRERMEAK